MTYRAKCDGHRLQRRAARRRRFFKTFGFWPIDANAPDVYECRFAQYANGSTEPTVSGRGFGHATRALRGGSVKAESKKGPT